MHEINTNNVLSQITVNFITKPVKEFLASHPQSKLTESQSNTYLLINK